MYKDMIELVKERPWKCLVRAHVVIFLIFSEAFPGNSCLACKMYVINFSVVFP